MATLYGDQGKVVLGKSELGGFRVDLSFPLVLSEPGDSDD
jgi:hypothetical protein